MPSHRSLRMAEAIREVVSSAILFEVSDPRVTGITVLRSEVTSDLKNATVYVSIMGTDQEQNLAMKGLQSAAGFLQAKVAARLQTRSTPHLTFKRDVGIKRSIEMSKIIDDALALDRSQQEAEAESKLSSESENHAVEEADAIDE
jgi:ribosome-binding factor A